MDRLSFQISEQLDYLQHTISPYVHSGSRAVRNVLNSAYAQLPGAPRNSDIPFTTWIQWQWSWFCEHCYSVGYYLRDCTTECGRTAQSFLLTLERRVSYNVLREHVEGSHVWFFLAGAGLGVLIGFQLAKSSAGKHPARMRALVCNSYKGPESIVAIEDQPAPTSCGPDEVLIQVKAASIDPVDLRISFGYGRVIRQQYHRYNKAHGKSSLFPFTLGRECSGRILEVGSRVLESETGEQLDVGDEVYAAVPYYACGVACELALVPATWVAKKPRQLSHEAAASLPYSACLVWNALSQAGLDPHNTAGKRILVMSADNPAGCLAVQLVRAWGGKVTATSGVRGLTTLQKLGLSADELVVHDGPEGNFQSRLSSLPYKFDLVVNTVGSFLHETCIAYCQPGGMVVSTVSSPPASDQYGILLGALYSAWLRIKMTAKGAVFGSAVISRSVLEEITRLVNQGHLQPVIERVFDIDQGEQAGRYAGQGDTVGKIVLRFR